MPKTKSRKLKPLTDQQIEDLAKIVCSCGDEPLRKSQALLVLMDEAERNNNVPWHVKRIAFASLADHDDDVMNAQTQLLRGELV